MFVAAAMVVAAACAGDAASELERRSETTQASGATAAPADCPPPRESSVEAVLPGDGAVNVGGVDLPAGAVRTAGFSDSPDTPVIWTTDAAVDNPWAVWAALVDAYPQTGLWPLLLTSLPDFGRSDGEGRPWLSNEFDLPADPATADGLTAEEAFAEWWAYSAPAEEDDPDWAAEVLGPLGPDVPSLAAAGTCAGALTDLASASTLSPLFSGTGGEMRIGLVAAHRPADALIAMGFIGAGNYTADLAAYTALMRSWEDRFGGYLVVTGFADVTIVMERPPVDGDALLHLAAEVYAICPDVVWQGVDTIAGLAEEIREAGQLFCWWD